MTYLQLVNYVIKREERYTEDGYSCSGQEEKCKVAPEVHVCAWLDLRDAVQMSMTSNCAAFVPCNEWQREQFELYNIYSRDPMYQTMATLLELEQYPRYAIRPMVCVLQMGCVVCDSSSHSES